MLFILLPYILELMCINYLVLCGWPGLPSGYWGRAAMDTEPGRCRRTDGKKWRCSRDVVTGQKYCERHMHRGRNRSRKHVEISTSTKYGRGAGGGGGGDAFLKNIHSTVQGVPSTTVTGGGPYFGLSAPVTSVDVLNRRLFLPSTLSFHQH